MQQGGSLYGAPPPDMTSFPSATGNRANVLGVSGSEHLQQQPGANPQQPAAAEEASPISSRPPQRASNFDELAAPAPGAFPDEEVLAAAGEEAERGVVSGNRWPRQETLALLKIRSDMDAAFRDATLKAPLWEDVSRKLAELGYKRGAKKCKEKFENVHKYYKRTKEGRAGRQDGKSYRFFSQLEALHGSSSASPTAASAVAISASVPATSTPNPTSSIGMVGSSGKLHPTPLNTIPPTVGSGSRVVPDPEAATTAAIFGPSAGISFSATSSSSASESEEDTEEGLTGEPRKRKRRGGGGGSRKMMAFFEGLMRQVMERQETMQQKFLETIEKREQDRMIREEAWKRQEMARLNREHEMMVQERAISASRDAAIIAFLQKMTGQTVPVQLPVPGVAAPQPPSQQPAPSAPVSPPPPQQMQPPPPQRRQSQQPQPQTQQHVQEHGAEVFRTLAPALDIVPVSESSETVVTGGGTSTDLASSRWPKSEVHALIKLRSELESRYQEAGPKGPLWEEIAAGMQRLGYNRSSKRCKEKWENINKYFKKVKESSKKRPEDSKTCPYFHQLDALYRKKIFGAGAAAAASGVSGAGSSLSNQGKEEPEASRNSASNTHDIAATALPQPPPPPQIETQGRNGGGGSSNNDDNDDNNNGGNPEGNGGSGLQIQTSNGEVKPGFFASEGTSSGGSVKKPEGIVKELMDRRQQQQHHQALTGDQDHTMELDGDDTDQECDEDEEDGEDGEMEYRIQYQQRPGVNGTSQGGGNKLSAAAAAATSSFMAMMQ